MCCKLGKIQIIKANITNNLRRKGKYIMNAEKSNPRSRRAARLQRESLVQVWIGKENYALVREAAKKTEMPISVFVRTHAIEAAHKTLGGVQ